MDEEPTPEGPPEEGDWVCGGARSTKWMTLPPTSRRNHKDRRCRKGKNRSVGELSFARNKARVQFLASPNRTIRTWKGLQKVVHRQQEEVWEPI